MTKLGKIFKPPESYNNLVDTPEIFPEDWLNNIMSSGRLWGGAISDAGSGKINIAQGAGLSKKETGSLSCGIFECSPTSMNQGQSSDVDIVTWANIYNFALAGVGYNLIYWDASAGAFAVSLKENFYSEFDFVRDFTIGRVYYDGTNITIRLCGMNIWNFNRRVQMFGEERFPVERATGLLISASGTRNIAISAGVIWAELVNRFAVGAFDSSGTDRFTYWYRGAVAGSWTSVASQSQINNTNYDDGDGTLGVLTANRYGVHWVYVVHNSTVHVVYGQGDYILAQAEAAAPPSTLPGLIGSYATLVGKIIIQKSATSFTEILSPFTTQFQASALANHNDLAGIQGGITNQYYHLSQAIYDSTVQNKLDGTADPTTADDYTYGWSAGSIWVNQTGNKIWICEDASVFETAVWRQIYPAVVATPNHNALTGLQGGNAITGQYYHLDLNDYDIADNLSARSGVVYPAFGERNLDTGDWWKQLEITITENDGGAINGRFLVHIWLSQTEFGPPDYDIGSIFGGAFSLSLTAGTMISPETFNDTVRMEILTDASSQIILEFLGQYDGTDVDDFVFVMAEVQGRVYSERIYIATGV